MSDFFLNLSNSMAEAVETASASVVQVAARRRMPASGVVWSSDGLIVTTHHVVEFDDRIRIGLPTGETLNAALVGRDPNTDIALLRVEGAALTMPRWAELNAVRVGQLALALGRPGDHIQATLGIVSAFHHSESDQKFFAQNDVVMYPGFSGGALVGAGGEVIGLNTSGLMGGASLTIQTPTIRYIVETLLKHGKMRRGFLGIGVQTVKLPPALAEQLQQRSGALIISVEANSPAEKAGLYLGDTLIALGSQTIHDMADVLAALGQSAIGSSVPAKLVRGGQVSELAVTIGERT